MTKPAWFGDLVAAYDANADEREARGEPDWRDGEKLEFIRKLGSGARILELGAGVGYSSRWFADRGLNVLATDLSGENVALCREKGLAAKVMDMTQIDEPGSSFDGVWAASCLMHIADRDLPGVLAGIAEVLRPGGWFWAGTWGGIDREGIWDEDFYEPKRFYSNRTDGRMRAFYEAQFEVEHFTILDPEPEFEWHYQMALMRKPADA